MIDSTAHHDLPFYDCEQGAGIPLQPVTPLQTFQPPLTCERAPDHCRLYRCPIHVPAGLSTSPYLVLCPCNFPCNTCLRNWRGAANVLTMDDQPEVVERDGQRPVVTASVSPQLSQKVNEPAPKRPLLRAFGMTCTISLIGVNLGVTLFALIYAVVTVNQRASVWICLVTSLLFSITMLFNMTVLQALKEARLTNLRVSEEISPGFQKVPKQAIYFCFWNFFITVFYFIALIILWNDAANGMK